MEDCGDLDFEHCLIRVCTEQDPQQQRDTLLHEIVHAVDFLLDTKLTETQVQRLATGLITTEPGIIGWIFDASDSLR